MSTFCYKITCAKTNKVYYGTSKSVFRRYDPLVYFLKTNEEKPDMYVAITQSVKEHGRESHIFKRISTPVGYEPRDFVNLLIEKSKEISLNDVKEPEDEIDGLEELNIYR